MRSFNLDFKVAHISIFCFIWVEHLAMLRAYFGLCAQVSLLLVLGETISGARIIPRSFVTRQELKDLSSFSISELFHCYQPKPCKNHVKSFFHLFLLRSPPTRLMFSMHPSISTLCWEPTMTLSLWFPLLCQFLLVMESSGWWKEGIQDLIKWGKFFSVA